MDCVLECRNVALCCSSPVLQGLGPEGFTTKLFFSMTYRKQIGIIQWHSNKTKQNILLRNHVCSLAIILHLSKIPSFHSPVWKIVDPGTSKWTQQKEEGRDQNEHLLQICHGQSQPLRSSLASCAFLRILNFRLRSVDAWVQFSAFPGSDQ